MQLPLPNGSTRSITDCKATEIKVPHLNSHKNEYFFFISSLDGVRRYFESVETVFLRDIQQMPLSKISDEIRMSRTMTIFRSVTRAHFRETSEFCQQYSNK